MIHTANLVELSADLPVLVDDDAHVEQLLPILDEMVTGGALVPSFQQLRESFVYRARRGT